jgi:dihydrodipicolinate synthase/N-acetylneuraminate lyase
VISPREKRRMVVLTSPTPVHPSPPEGLVVDLVTPLTGERGLDGAGLKRLAARVTPAAAGILAGSPGVGEALDLPLPTRRDLISSLLAAVAGRMPVFLGVTGNSPEETRQLALHLSQECRARRYPGPVFMADLPLWYHSNRGLPQFYRLLLDEVPLPLVLFNLPGVIARRAPVFKRRNLRTHVFKKLALLDSLAGLIYQGEMGRFLNYHHVAASRPGFAFYEGDEVNFLTRPGAWGVLSPGAQLLPGPWQRVTRACLHPEEAAADHQARLELWSLSQGLLELARLCRPHPAALIKAALTARGVINSATTATPGPPDLDAATNRILELMVDLAPSEGGSHG